MLNKTLFLEIDKPNYVPLYTVQYDYNSRFYEITILNNSQPLDLTGIRVIVGGKKPDGKEVFNSCKVLDAKKGLIQLELTEQMNAVNGASEYALELFSADGMLSSQPFKLIVTRSTISKSVESSKELGALKDALNEVQDIDNRFAQTNAQLSEKASEIALNVERERINNLTKLSEGSTTGDAELIDARVSSSGLTYQNVGTNIRSISGNGNIDFTHSPLRYGELYLTPLKSLSPLEMGHLGATGEPVTSTTRVRSKDFYVVSQDSTLIIVNKNPSFKILMITYDENENWVKTGGWQKTELITFNLSTSNKYKFLIGKVDNSELTVTEAEVVFFISPNKKEFISAITNQLLDDSLKYDKRTRLGESAHIILADGQFPGKLPNIDTTNKTLTFYNDTILVYGNRYSVLTGNVVIKYDLIGSSAKKIYFNTNSKDFELINYNQSPSSEDCVLVCALRVSNTTTNNNAYMSITCPYTVNGVQPYDLSNYALKTDIPSIPDITPISSNVTKSSINCIAHQGFNLSAPNATIPAFQLAAEHGFTHCEGDIKMTSDNIPVICHDETIDRYSNGTGRIDEMTYQELLQYDFGSWKDPKYTGTKICTFEEMVKTCKKFGTGIYIDHIHYAFKVQGGLQTLFDIIDKYGMKDKATWLMGGTAQSIIDQLSAWNPNVRICFTFNELTDDLINEVLAIKNERNQISFNINYQNITVEQIQQIRKLDKKIGIELWTINDATLYEEKSYFVDGITSDNLTMMDVL